MIRKGYFREVWEMWRQLHGFNRRRIYSFTVWFSVLGILPTIVTAILWGGSVRYTMIGISVFFTVFLLISFFRASESVWKRDTTKLGLIEYERQNISQFLHPRFLQLYLCGNNEIRLDVEWFNGSVFEVQFESVNGNAKLKDIELNHISSNVNLTCYAGQNLTCTLYFPEKDEAIEELQKCISEVKPVNVFTNLNWQIKVPEIDYSFKQQGPRDIVSIVPKQG